MSEYTSDKIFSALASAVIALRQSVVYVAQNIYWRNSRWAVLASGFSVKYIINCHLIVFFLILETTGIRLVG